VKSSRLFAVTVLAVSFAVAATHGNAADDAKEEGALKGAANGQKLAVDKGCAGCHGADGNSESSVNPKLAGQYESYLIRALSDYKSGARNNVTMAGFAQGLSDREIRDLAAWFSAQESTLYTLEN